MRRRESGQTRPRSHPEWNYLVVRAWPKKLGCGGLYFFLCFLCVGLSAVLEIGDRVCERVREKK